MMRLQLRKKEMQFCFLNVLFINRTRTFCQYTKLFIYFKINMLMINYDDYERQSYFYILINMLMITYDDYERQHTGKL